MKLSQPLPEARCYTFSRQYGALLGGNLGVVTVTLFSSEGTSTYMVTMISSDQFGASGIPQLTIINPGLPQELPVMVNMILSFDWRI